MDTKPKVAVPTARLDVSAPTHPAVGPRVRIATLWIVFAVSMASGILLALLEPGVIEDVIAGRVEDTDITVAITLLFAGFILLPLVMAYLALVLPDASNRWANGIVAGLLSLMDLSDLYTHVADGTFGGEALMMAATVVAGLAIVWNAWRWKSANSVS